MKYWWPHTEALYALLLAYEITKDDKYANWYGKMADYTFSHFRDPNPSNGGEWFGYLHRDGTPASPLKGNMWKGPSHIPRSLKKCLDLLEKQ
ncbi:MAG: hypothetical protein B6241_15080 [Spirochaetaceae bacterium 4572_59]|nr:MAG: hypothetical protein B6241_15080 [Spirochaetaceae bacterium 4572_59]